jgi:hypothetical protein
MACLSLRPEKLTSSALTPANAANCVATQAVFSAGFSYSQIDMFTAAFRRKPQLFNNLKISRFTLETRRHQRSLEQPGK